MQSVVESYESYESYEWTEALSSRQSKLSSGKMHLIKETYKISVRVSKAIGPLQSVVTRTNCFQLLFLLIPYFRNGLFILRLVPSAAVFLERAIQCIYQLPSFSITSIVALFSLLFISVP